MRGALIGCGFFAQNHLHAWREMKAQGVELVAVCDLDPAKAQAAARTFGIAAAFDDPERLFAETPLDFVDIATRMDTHAALAGLAARHGVAAIVQKPFAPTLQEARAIVAQARASGARLAVHENFRFQPPIRRLKQELDSGAIGAPSFARISFRTGYDVYANQPYFHREERLIILDLGVHLIDLARYLIGEIERVSCETQRRNPANLGEDTATMILRHVGGAVSAVDLSYEARVHPDPFPQTTVEIEGPAGALTLGPDRTLRRAVGGASAPIPYELAPLSWVEEPWRVVQESVLRTQEAIIGSWRRAEEAETSGDDNLKTFAAAEAAYASAASGRATAPVQS
jgi:predicted dehydrogenase